MLSTDVDPRTGEPNVSAATGLAQHEPWEGRTDDDGRIWTWAAVTAGSALDNLRPDIVAGDGTWAPRSRRGRYTDFEDDYDQELVAVIRSSRNPQRVTHVW